MAEWLERRAYAVSYGFETRLWVMPIKCLNLWSMKSNAVKNEIKMITRLSSGDSQPGIQNYVTVVRDVNVA